MKNLYSTKLAILPMLLLSACSQSFHTVESFPSQEPSSEVSSNDPASAIVSSQSETAQTEDGELKTSQNLLVDQSTEFDINMNVPFGRVYSALSSFVRDIAPKVCKLSPDLQADGENAYAKGEIPCGTPYSRDWKKITHISIDEFNKSGSTETKVWAFDLPILLSRMQYQGYYNEARLDNRRQEKLLSSKELGEDISLRYVPNGQSSRTELCMNIPGVAIRAPEVNVKARVRKKVLGIRISKTADFGVNPGQAKYDYGRACFALDLGWTRAGVASKLVATEKPHLMNIKHEKFNIKIKDWFLRFVDNFMSFFKKSLRTKIMNKVRSTVNKILDQEIETGAWFTRIHGDELLEKTGKKFNKKAGEVISRIASPSNKADFKELLSDNCRLLKFGSEKWNQRLEFFCGDVVDQLDFRIEPFSVDQKSKDLGCYSYFANIHTTEIKGEPQWWSSQCKFSMKIKVKVPAIWSEYAKEFKEVLAHHIDQNRVPEEWVEKMEELKLSTYKLNVLLKELEARGIRQLNEHDWRTTIPQLIAELREKELQL